VAVTAESGPRVPENATGSPPFGAIASGMVPRRSDRDYSESPRDPSPTIRRFLPKQRRPSPRAATLLRLRSTRSTGTRGYARPLRASLRAEPIVYCPRRTRGGLRRVVPRGRAALGGRRGARTRGRAAGALHRAVLGGLRVVRAAPEWRREAEEAAGHEGRVPAVHVGRHHTLCGLPAATQWRRAGTGARAPRGASGARPDRGRRPGSGSRQTARGAHARPRPSRVRGSRRRGTT